MSMCMSERVKSMNVRVCVYMCEYVCMCEAENECVCETENECV